MVELGIICMYIYRDTCIGMYVHAYISHKQLQWRTGKDGRNVHHISNLSEGLKVQVPKKDLKDLGSMNVMQDIGTWITIM